MNVVFRILDELTSARRALGVTEISQLIEEPKPRVYRYLASMRRKGVLEQELSSDKYRLGAKLMFYGEAAGEQFDLRLIADPYLTKLRDKTRQTAILSVATDASAVVIATAESSNKVCISVKPGNRVATHCSAQGRIVLAYCDEATQRRALKKRLEKCTDRSIVDPEAVIARLGTIRERLYEDANGEVMDAVNVLAAPIFRDQGELVGTIGIIGASRDIPSPPPDQLLTEIQSAAAALSKRLNSDAYARVLDKSR